MTAACRLCKLPQHLLSFSCLPPVTTAVVSGLHHFSAFDGTAKPKLSACADPILRAENKVPRTPARNAKLRAGSFKSGRDDTRLDALEHDEVNLQETVYQDRISSAACTDMHCGKVEAPSS